MYGMACILQMGINLKSIFLFNNVINAVDTFFPMTLTRKIRNDNMNLVGWS